MTKQEIQNLKEHVDRLGARAINFPVDELAKEYRHRLELTPGEDYCVDKAFKAGYHARDTEVSNLAVELKEKDERIEELERQVPMYHEPVFVKTKHITKLNEIITRLESELKEKDAKISEISEERGFWKKEACLHSDAREQFKERATRLESAIETAIEGLENYSKAGYPLFHSCGSIVGKNALTKIREILGGSEQEGK